MSSGAYTLKLSRTLYNDTFRAQLLDENQQVIGHLRIVPGVPLDRSLVPEDAPSVPAYLLVIVDDADINKDNLNVFQQKQSVSSIANSIILHLLSFLNRQMHLLILLCEKIPSTFLLKGFFFIHFCYFIIFR